MATWKEKYNKKYDYPKSESHSLSDISKETGVSKKGIQQIYNKGIGAYKTNPQSVRPNVTSKEQWAMARVYSSVMGGKASKVDAKELKMQMGGEVYAKGDVISGKKLKQYVDKSDYGDDLSFLDYIEDKDYYVLKNIDVNVQIQKDGTLRDYINSIVELEPNENEYEWINKTPIIVGDSDYERGVVLDGYHRIRQAKSNREKTISAFVKTLNNQKFAKGGTIECGSCDWSWDRKDGGDDMYVCHKCGTDNTENYMNKSINDLERSEFYKGYYKRLSPSNFNVMQKGGKIQIDLPMAISHDGIDEVDAIANGMFKKGGETDFNPDGKIKDKIVHASGDAGGMLVGKRHSNGGIKALNKSTGQPLEMEGGEVVITRDAVSDNKKRSFNGKMMTNRQILSAINESGGGVSFADGGQVPNDVQFDCNAEYEYGGKTMCGKDLAYALGGVTTAIVTDPNEAMADLQSTYGFGDVYAKGGIISEKERNEKEIRYINSLKSKDCFKPMSKFQSKFSFDLELIADLLKKIDKNFTIDTNPNNFGYTFEKGGSMCLFDIEDVQDGGGAWKLIKDKYSTIEPFENPINNDNYVVIGIGEASQGGVFLDKRDGSVIKLTASPFEVLGTHKVMEAQKNNEDYLYFFPAIDWIKNVGKLKLEKNVHTKYPSSENYYAIRRSDIVPFDSFEQKEVACYLFQIIDYWRIVENVGYGGKALLMDEFDKGIEVVGKYYRNNYKKGGEVNEAYVDFMNKDKGFKVERKYFKTYEDAEKWARNEFEKFYPDMIGYTEYERPLTNYDKGGDVKKFEYPLTSDDKEFLYQNALISVEKDGKLYMIGIIMGVYTDMLKLKPLYVSEEYDGATIESSLSISEQILIDILNGNPQSVTVFNKMEYLTDINNIKGLTSFQIETARKILKAYFGNLSLNFMEFFEKTLNPNAPDVEKVVLIKGGDAKPIPFDSYNQLYKNFIQGKYVDSQYGNRIKIQVNNNTVESFEFRVGRKKVIKKWDNTYWRIGNGKKTPPYYDFLLSLFGVGLEGYSRTNYNYIRFIDPSKTSFTEREQELKKAIDKLISEGYKVLPVIDLRNQNLKHNDIVNEETGDVDSIIIDEENKKILLEEWDANKKQFYLYQKLGFIPKNITPQDVTIIAPLVNYSKQKNYLEGRIKALATELELKKVALKNEEIAFYLREIKLFTRRLRELNQVDIEQNDTIKKRLQMSFNKQWGDINQKYPACKFPSINGKPSQLTKEEFITVRTENFKLFFGDWEEAYEDKNYINVSKVIDNVTKEPLAVYHGTNVLFTNWKTYESNNAHYFTVKRKMANFFATTWDSRGDKAGVDSQIIKKLNPNTGEFVYRCFLDIRNPIDFSRFGIDKRPIKDFLDFLKINYNIYDFDFFSNLNTNKEKVLETKVFAWQIIRMWQNFTTYIRLYTTYDGYIFYEFIPDSAKQGLEDASLSFCTFDSDQNKFANSNEFNSLSLDSRFENGGKI